MFERSADIIDIDSPGIIDIEVEILEVEKSENGLFAGREFLVSTRDGSLNKILPKLGDMCFAAHEPELSVEIIPGHELYQVIGIMPSDSRDEIVRKKLSEGFVHADPLTVVELSYEVKEEKVTTFSTFWRNKYFVLKKYFLTRTDFFNDPCTESIVVLMKPD